MPPFSSSPSAPPSRSPSGGRPICRGAPWLGLTLVYSFAVGADSAIYSTSVTEAAEAGKLGSTLAVHTFTGFLGGILSPVIFGAFLDLSDGDAGWGLGFSTAGLAGVIAIAAMLWLRRQPEARALAGAPSRRAGRSRLRGARAALAHASPSLRAATQSGRGNLAG